MNNNNQPKKQYSMEDNVKYISFGIKDLVKELQTLNELIKEMIARKSGF